MLRPAHFTNMNQAFNPFLKFNKCSIISDRDNTALHAEIVWVFVANFIPGVWLQLLQAERYPLGFFVKVDNCNVEFLVQSDDLIRVLYTAPGEVCNVKKAVHTTQEIGRASCRERAGSDGGCASTAQQ